MSECVVPTFLGQKSRRRDYETSRFEMRQLTPRSALPHTWPSRELVRSRKGRNEDTVLVDEDTKPHQRGRHSPLIG